MPINPFLTVVLAAFFSTFLVPCCDNSCAILELAYFIACGFEMAFFEADIAFWAVSFAVFNACTSPLSLIASNASLPVCFIPSLIPSLKGLFNFISFIFCFTLAAVCFKFDTLSFKFFSDSLAFFVLLFNFCLDSGMFLEFSNSFSAALLMLARICFLILLVLLLSGDLNYLYLLCLYH